jgi:wobble nucleotide-excising tRNase
MIEKILKIFSVGRFEDYSSTGDVGFKKNTFIYAENGRGKTTLSAIFRSLKRNEPIFVNERSTLGNDDEPNIELRANGENFIFKDKKWNKDKKDIEVFDSTFVNQNVFSGENVEHDHKKNLYHFIVGEKGVSIAQKVNELDLKIREKGNEITKREAEIQKHIIGSSISINNFLNLVDTPGIDNLITKKEKEVEVIKKSSVIVSRSSLQILTLPEFPQEDLTKLLNSKLESVLKEAEEKTKRHIKINLDNQGEAWIQKGMAYLKDDNCPFCGQNCESIDLIKAYNGYFDEEYNKLKDNISYAIQNIQNLFSESALIHVNNNYTSNSSLSEFWSQYVEIKMTELSFEEIQESWKNLRETSLAQLKEKELSPLESISISEDLKKSIEQYYKINEKIGAYNENIKDINDLIQKKKLSAGGGNLYLEEQELEKLLNYVINTKS